MRYKSQIVAALIASLALVYLVSATPAEAAKGVKKIRVGRHRIHATVVAVRDGVIAVRVRHHHKKRGVKLPRAKVTEFAISSGTVYTLVDGKLETPGSLADVRKGVQLWIDAEGNGAVRVAVHRIHHKKK